MKLELWEQDMISFMKDASEYANYNQQLAEKMLPWLKKDMHICDAGSGLGYLSLELAPHAKQVTAVELNPGASAVLTDNCEKRGITNVLSRCGAIADVLPEKPYEAMVFCFFGRRLEILNLAKQQCTGEIFVFTRNYDSHRFSAGHHRSGYEGFPHFSDLLTELGIPFHFETFTLEFGQPFRSLEDAHRFFRLYSKDRNKEVLTEDFIRSQLTETNRADFPFYMPHQKHIGFLHLSVKDIPDVIPEGE